MDDLELKKKIFKAVCEGKNSFPLSVEEAKKRLKQTDPGIDISLFLEALNNPSEDKLKVFLIEIFTNPEIIAYFAPVLKFILIKLLVRE